MPEGVDARAHLRVGWEIRTLTGRPNRVLEVRGTDVIVATERSPNGQPFPIQWVQDALHVLVDRGEIEISVETVGYRSVFIGAALASLPGATTAVTPRRVRLRASD